MKEEFSEKELEIQLVMAAHSLLRDWLLGDNITEYIENPRAEMMIIEAAAELENVNDQEEWITLVRGDGLDQRRLQLVERCRERIAKKNNSLRSK